MRLWLWDSVISHQYTRPREPTNERRSHQNAGFSIWVFKNFPGVIPPDPYSWRGRPPPALTPSPASGRPGVGTQTLVPLNFSAVVAPLLSPTIRLHNCFFPLYLLFFVFCFVFSTILFSLWLLLSINERIRLLNVKARSWVRWIWDIISRCAFWLTLNCYFVRTLKTKFIVMLLLLCCCCFCETDFKESDDYFTV